MLEMMHDNYFDVSLVDNVKYSTGKVCFYQTDDPSQLGKTQLEMTNTRLRHWTHVIVFRNVNKHN